MSVVIVVVALSAAAVLAFTPSIRASRSWKATVTPLASIMGSGFLVSAPLIAGEAGLYSPLAMAGLLVLAFLVGSMIRFNIRYAEPRLDGPPTNSEHRLHHGHHELSAAHWDGMERRLARPIEQLSHVVLAAAYVISVTYYLQLLSAFVLDRFGIRDLVAQRLLTTGVLLVIAFVGARRGLKALERVETYAVSLNLGMIAALLVALAIHAVGAAIGGHLRLPDLPLDPDPIHGLRTIVGLLVIVQGFETSRFLGAAHPPEERARTMRTAQIVASVIYLVFVTLCLPLFNRNASAATVTAIVHLVAPVAVLLPLLIVVAAVGSQFSAAVADDAGCAGLLSTLFASRLSPRLGYVLIGAATICLTWFTDVLAVISIASRAFALFYALQCAIAAATAHEMRTVPRRRLVMALGILLGAVCLAVVVFGIPAE